MSTKAAIAGGATFAAGLIFFGSIYIPPALNENLEQSMTNAQERSERSAEVAEGVKSDIIKTMSQEYNLDITEEQAAKLNCRHRERMPPTCFHHDLIERYTGQSRGSLIPQVDAPVKDYGSIRIDGSTYTLSAYTSSQDFYINQS